MLTRKQQLFIEAYLATWNASEAARQAGYSPRSAPSIGQENLKKPEVAAEIARRIADEQIKPAEVLVRLSEQARADIGTFFRFSERWTPSPLPSDEIIEERAASDAEGNPVREYLARRTVLDVTKLADPRYGRLVKKFGDSPRAGLSIELHDSQAALALLGKALGVLRENVTVSNEGPLEVVTRIVRKEPAAADGSAQLSTGEAA